MLSELRAYLMTCGRAPLSDLALRLDASPDAVRGMLQHLIAKGRVRTVEGQACEGCCKCAPETLEMYEWLG